LARNARWDEKVDPRSRMALSYQYGREVPEANREAQLTVGQRSVAV